MHLLTPMTIPLREKLSQIFSLFLYASLCDQLGHSSLHRLHLLVVSCLTLSHTTLSVTVVKSAASTTSYSARKTFARGRACGAARA